MVKYLLISFFLLLNVSFVFSQKDTLFELGVNKKLISEHQKELIKKGSSRNNKDILLVDTIMAELPLVLSLPFIDDFAQNWHHPDNSKWEDNFVFINSNFPINPVSYGVATFDGLDQNGFPYDFSNPTSYGIADYLTSKRINLSSITDSVFLSFYYQAQGNGNDPELKDSIQLEFFHPTDSIWKRVWGVGDTTTHAFRKAMVPVQNVYHTNTFQFRFKNYATLSGNADHWHIDYVYLNDNRSSTDTALYDVSFVTNHHNMIKEFTAMPWSHYLTDSINFMATNMEVEYRNNHSDSFAVFYKYKIYDNNGAGPLLETYPSSASSKFAAAYSSLVEPQAVYNTPINDFYFPPDAGVATKVFQIKNYFDLNAFTDSNQVNDTVISHQVFGTYYAYDDRSAEAGYGVQGVGSKLAHQFNIKKSDTLTALQIYFNPLIDNKTSQTFKITVWSSLSPETIIYQQTAYYSPVYSFTNEFLNYQLKMPLYLPAGTYYFGWEKISAEFLNVGWDVNTNNKTKVHFNASGVWQNSSFNGSLMLRPVFGSGTDPVVGAKELTPLTNDDFKVYPNPCSEHLYFEEIGQSNNEHQVELIDIYGKTIIQTETTANHKMNITNISNGIYFIRFINQDTHQIITKKVIISK